MPVPTYSQVYKQAYAKLNNATYADLEKLGAEFDEYADTSIPVRHYKHKGQWYAKPVSGGTAQKLNMKGIQRHGKKWFKSVATGNLGSGPCTLRRLRKRDVAFA